jgi:hypothetical protein
MSKLVIGRVPRPASTHSGRPGYRPFSVIVLTNSKPPRRPGADAARNLSNTAPSTLAAAGCWFTAFGLSISRAMQSAACAFELWHYRLRRKSVDSQPRVRMKDFVLLNL